MKREERKFKRQPSNKLPAPPSPSLAPQQQVRPTTSPHSQRKTSAVNRMGKPLTNTTTPAHHDSSSSSRGLKLPTPAPVRVMLPQLSRTLSKNVVLDEELLGAPNDDDDDDEKEDDKEDADDAEDQQQLQRAAQPITPPVRVKSVGSATSEGLTGHANEDRFVVHCGPHFHLFAVMDGHGGHKAADYVVQTLYKTLEKVFITNHGCFVHKQIVDAIETLDKTFLTTASRQQDDSGACFNAVVLYYDPSSQCHQKLVLNCGDCRAVAREAPERSGAARGHGNRRRSSGDSRDDRHKATITALSEDHCHSNRSERMRALEAGAFLRNGRIAGILEPFRSIGDLDMKGKSMAGWVIATPEIRESELLVGRTTIVIASDGVWGVLSNQRAVMIAHQELSDGGDAQSAAEAIADEAREIGSSDDITVVVVSV